MPDSEKQRGVLAVVRSVVVLIVIVMGVSVAALLAHGAEAVHPALATAVKPALTSNRGPFEIAFSPDGRLVYVTEFDEGAVAVIERATGRVTAHWPTGGEEPTGIAVTPDGAFLIVTNSFSDSVALLSASGDAEPRVLPIPGGPYEVVITPDGATAFVSLSRLDQVAVLDLKTGEFVTRIPVGRRPRALSLSANGAVLAVANMNVGTVSFIDVASRRVTATGRTPAVNLRGVAITRNGRAAYVTGQRAQNERPTESAVGIWSNQAFIVRPVGLLADNIWLDLLGEQTADPDGVVLSADGSRAYFTCSGGHSLTSLSLRGGYDVKQILNIGAQPKGLTLSPDGSELWVACTLSNEVVVVDPAAFTVKRRIDLGPTRREDPHLLGRFLFNTATLTKGEQFSCNSCHPDGITDGISWNFIHVPDQFGKEIARNVRGLRGNLKDTAPFRWTGFDADVETFTQVEITKLLESPPLPKKELDALVGFLTSQRLPPNPYRGPDQTFTAAALRGQALFIDKAECSTCHAGPNRGGTRKVWVGTTPEGVEVDVPHLVGVYDTWPYMHHGKAQSLAEVFTRYNSAKKHGKAHLLTPQEIADVIRYVREL